MAPNSGILVLVLGSRLSWSLVSLPLVLVVSNLRCLFLVMDSISLIVFDLDIYGYSLVL